MSKKGPRGLTKESFNDYIMFHLLTVFLNNAAKQEMYYFSNMLKKPQRVSVCQFIQHVEQLNAYIAQLLLVLQPKLRHRHDAGKCSICRG